MKRLFMTMLCLAVLAAAADALGGGSDSASGSTQSYGNVPVTGYYRSIQASAAPRYLATAPGARDSQGQLVRSESARREFMRQTGYPHGRPGYVVGHIVPLKRGGCDCPANMRWQTARGGEDKG